MSNEDTQNKPVRAVRGKVLPDVIGDLSDSDSFASHLTRFYEWGRVQQYTKTTLHNWVAVLRTFTQWCLDRGISQPKLVTYQVLCQYQRHLFHYRKSNGEPLSPYSQSGKLRPVRSFFKWLAKEHYILFNPASELAVPQPRRGLPKGILTPQEMETLLTQPDIEDPFGLRDRAIMELFYSTGIRRFELTNLQLTDVDAHWGAVFIRQGKGGKDRMVPLGERAYQWLNKYLETVRPKLVQATSEHTIFLNQYGAPMSIEALSHKIRVYIEKAEIDKPGSCHLFRHSMATHMLENGADIRYIQEMLGHSSIKTTQIYTQVTIKALKAVHNQTHPARLVRQGEDHEC